MNEKIAIRSAFKDIKNFNEIPERRKGIIAEAPETPLRANYAVNSIANFLHPPTQFLRVKQVAEIKKDVRAYVLEPDTSNGTAKLAYFRPGQAISVKFKSGDSVITRPFTLCSSPIRSTEDEYVIIVKKKINGYVSDFIINNWRTGTKIEASAPFGRLYYQPLRDSKNIMAICDSEGIAPFLSMAESIADGSLNADLTILYAVRKESEAIMQERLDELAEICEHFKVIYVLSDEFIQGKERGFITKSLIEKYSPVGKYSVFVNGTQDLISRITPQLNDLSLDKKYIRYGAAFSLDNAERNPDFPQNTIGKTFLCKVIRNDKLIATAPCSYNETLLSALEKEGVSPKSMCRTGECGFCKSRLISGDIYVPSDSDSRRFVDLSNGIIHPCCSYPTSDITIEII